MPATRAGMLELAWQVALDVPLDPHTKDRSKLLQQVVRAWIAVGQPSRAAELARSIHDWRRGDALAEVAEHCAGHGDAVLAARLVDEALAVADERSREANEQAWRAQRIRARAAAVLASLGRQEDSLRLARQVGVQEWGPLSTVEARHLDPAKFDEAVAAMVAAEGNGLDAARNAMRLGVGLLDRFVADDARRERLSSLLAEGFTKTPPPVRVEQQLAAQAVVARHGRKAEAERLCAAARTLVVGERWVPEDRVRAMAELATAWHRAGFADEAQKAIDAAIAAFTADKAEILDLYRSMPLRAIAEARHRCADPAGAMLVWTQALEAGFENRNPRPRAEDLCALLLSIATHDALPDDSFWQRLQGCARELRTQW